MKLVFAVFGMAAWFVLTAASVDPTKGMMVEARSSIAKGDFDAAREKLLQVETMRPGAARKAIANLDQQVRTSVKLLLQNAGTAFREHDYERALNALNEAEAFTDDDPLVYLDLGLTYAKLNDYRNAVVALDRCLDVLTKDDLKETVGALQTAFITNTTPKPLSNKLRQEQEDFNRLVIHTPLFSRGDVERQQKKACETLESLLVANPDAAAVIYDSALCAEFQGKQSPAAGLYAKYLSLAPTALDADDVKGRIALLLELSALPEDRGQQIRTSYASAQSAMLAGSIRIALDEYLKADGLVTSGRGSNEGIGAETKWRIASFYESIGDLVPARDYLRQLTDQANPVNEREPFARGAIDALDTKRAIYDQSVRGARRLLLELKPASSAIIQSHILNEVATALKPAVLQFPYGWEANELLAYVHLQTGNYRLAVRSLDAIWGQGRAIAVHARVRRGNSSQKQPKDAGWRSACVAFKPNSLEVAYGNGYCDPFSDEYLQPAKAPDERVARDQIGKVHTSALGPSVVELHHPAGDTYEIAPDFGLLTWGRIRERPKDTIYFKPHPLDRIQGNKATRLFQRYLRIEDVKLGPESFSGKELTEAGLVLSLTGLSIYAHADTGKWLQNVNLDVMLFRAAQLVKTDVQDFSALARYQRQVTSSSAFRLLPTAADAPFLLE